MATVNVSIEVDVQKLANNSKLTVSTDPTKPTHIGDWKDSDVYICMTAPRDVVTKGDWADNDEGEGASELSVNANASDTIQWTISSFDANADYTVYLYAVGYLGGTNSNGYMEDPARFQHIPLTSYLPPGKDPTVKPEAVHNALYVAKADVLKTGSAQIRYNLSFAVVNNTSQQISYYYWDPFINISGS